MKPTLKDLIGLRDQGDLLSAVMGQNMGSIATATPTFFLLETVIGRFGPFGTQSRAEVDRIIIPRDGVWRMSWGGRFSAAGSDARAFTPLINGVTINTYVGHQRAIEQAIGLGAANLWAERTLPLKAGAIIQLQGTHNSGSTITNTAGAFQANIELERLR